MLFVLRPVRNVEAAEAAIAHLRGLEPGATHNMTAYITYDRSGKKEKLAKRYDDDGEAHGGMFTLSQMLIQ